MNDAFRFERQKLRAEMNEFDRAKDTYFRNKSGMDRSRARHQIAEVKVEVIEEKENPVATRPKQDGVITVNVSLPDKEFRFTLTKPNVYANVNKSKLTEDQLRKAVITALLPLMGAMK